MNPTEARAETWLKSKVIKVGKSTLYIRIPSKIANASTFIIKDGDEVEITYDTIKNVVIIRKKALSK